MTRPLSELTVLVTGAGRGRGTAMIKNPMVPYHDYTSAREPGRLGVTVNVISVGLLRTGGCHEQVAVQCPRRVPVRGASVRRDVR